MRLRDHRSIVGIDPTPEGIAFAFFEDGELLDWAHLEGEPEDDVQLALLDRSKRKARMRYLLRLFALHASPISSTKAS